MMIMLRLTLPPISSLFPYTRSSDLLGAILPFRPQRKGKRELRRDAPSILQERSQELVRGEIAGASRRSSRLRSEEHTSELQSLRQLVCRLLLEKKRQYNTHKLKYET